MNIADFLRFGSFFSSTSGDQGQLSPDERRLLYQTVPHDKPDTCLECGTWKGLGSTFYIASALKRNRTGMLYTFEVDKDLYTTAVAKLKERKVDRFVKCHLADFIHSVSKYDFASIDFAFLDGPEDGQYQLDCLMLIEGRMGPGRAVVLHDWKAEKNRLTREYVANTAKWSVEKSLDTVTGICLLRKARP
jgi:predicted O-methyltransferase YrrM